MRYQKGILWVRSVVVLLLALFLPVLYAYAQPPTKGQAQRVPLYQRGVEKTIKGSLQEIQNIPGKTPAMSGARLIIKTTNGDIVTAILGPSSYISSKGYVPKEGDEVSIVGSILDVNGEKLLITKSMTVGSKTIQLRDAQGLPLWSKGKIKGRQSMPYFGSGTKGSVKKPMKKTGPSMIPEGPGVQNQ